jgi:hypothetical protein
VLLRDVSLPKGRSKSFCFNTLKSRWHVNSSVEFQLIILLIIELYKNVFQEYRIVLAFICLNSNIITMKIYLKTTQEYVLNPLIISSYQVLKGHFGSKRSKTILFVN